MGATRGSGSVLVLIVKCDDIVDFLLVILRCLYNFYVLSHLLMSFFFLNFFRSSEMAVVNLQYTEDVLVQMPRDQKYTFHAFNARLGYTGKV